MEGYSFIDTKQQAIEIPVSERRVFKFSKDSESSDGSTCGFTYVPGTRPDYPFVFVPAFGKRPVGKFKELT